MYQFIWLYYIFDYFILLWVRLPHFFNILFCVRQKIWYILSLIIKNWFQCNTHRLPITKFHFITLIYILSITTKFYIAAAQFCPCHKDILYFVFRSMFQLQTKREYFCAFFCICSFIAINFILLLNNKFMLSLHIISKLIFKFSLIRDFFIIVTYNKFCTQKYRITLLNYYKGENHEYTKWTY